MKSLHVLLLAGGLAACSSSSEGGASPSSSAKTASEVDRITTATCQAEANGDACDGQQRIGECQQSSGRCRASLIRSDAFDALDACYAKRDCKLEASTGGCTCAKSDDACFEEVARVLAGTPARDRYERACIEKLSACGQAFSNDWCTTGDVPWRLYEDRVLDGLAGCFGSACGGVNTCLRDKIVELGGAACGKKE